MSSPSSTGVIRAEGLEHPCEIGFHAEEFGRLQTLEVDFEAVVDWSEAAAHDDPALLPLDYHEADLAIGRLLQSRRWNLVESVAEAVAAMLLDTQAVTRVRVCIRKRPLGMPHARAIAVECSRGGPASGVS